MNEAFPWRDIAKACDVDLTQGLTNEEILTAIEVWASTAEQTLAELDDQALAWETIRQIREQLAVLEACLAPRMHDQIPAKPGWIDTPAGILKRHWKGTKWHWNENGVLQELVAHALANRNYNGETGEVEGEAEALVRHLKATAAFGYFRTRDLQSRQIDPNKYRTREDGRPWVTSV